VHTAFVESGNAPSPDHRSQGGIDLLQNHGHGLCDLHGAGVRTHPS
jgi:hypothetical protein